MNTIPARWYTSVGPSRPKQLIVLHSMEAPDKPDTAEAVGRFFANLPATKKASAHVGADVDSACRYVKDDDVAYGANGANHNGLHIELAGYARYNAGDWSQPDMMAMLQQAAAQVRDWCDRYNIPKTFVRAADLRAGRYGITTHFECEQAWPRYGHVDPGPNFPIGAVLLMVNNGGDTTVSAAGAPAPTSQGDDDMGPYLYETCPTGGYWLIKRADGGVFAYQGAPFLGALPGRAKILSPIVAFAPYVKAGVVAGYWLLGADGGVFALGAAPFTDSYAGHPEWHGGNRQFLGITQHGEGYDLVSVVPGTDPPQLNTYDLSVHR